MKSLTRAVDFSYDSKCITLYSKESNNAVHTPSNGWSCAKLTKKNRESEDVESDVQHSFDSNEHENDDMTSDEVISRALGIPAHDISNNGQNATPTNEDCGDGKTVTASPLHEESIGMPADDEDVVLEGYFVTDDDIQDIMHVLRQGDRNKWEEKTAEDLAELLTSPHKLNKLLKKELSAIAEYFNIKLRRESTTLLNVRNVSKVEIVNQLAKFLGEKERIQKKERKRKAVSPKSLQELSAAVLMRKKYPKQVLNIAYATYLWPRREKERREKSHVAGMVNVVGIENGDFEPYYVPDYDEDRQDFDMFTYDKTHLGTNLRKAVCLNKVEGISIRAWHGVSKIDPNILNRSIIDVSPDGKILDQMKKLAKSMFTKSVEEKMLTLGYKEEGRFCRVIREGLFEADDTPGIPAKDRCEKRLDLIRWLSEDVNFGRFPPYGARIKGLSHILYEGLRCSQEAKLYLYAICKKGTYCVRAPNTLFSESFFSTMQEMDPWGQGILTTTGVEKHIADFTVITAMKMQDNRNLYIKTKKDTAYPEPQTLTMTSGAERETNDQGPSCSCRQNRFIKCIVPRDHFFDSANRERNRKTTEAVYRPKSVFEAARGELPIRSQYGYSINESKLMPSRRMGLYL